jgi:hypothetical protein
MMSEVIDLKPVEDDELIENLARFADGTLSEAQVKARHHLTNKAWRAMGESDRLVELVEAAKLRRIRTGATKMERAQIEIIDGPPILAKIMRSPDSNARHVSRRHPVTVHILMAVHPSYREHSFDCLLHSLMQRKRKLAESALWPMGDTDGDAAELQRMVAEGAASTARSDEPVKGAMEAMFARDGLAIPAWKPDGSLAVC